MIQWKQEEKLLFLYPAILKKSCSKSQAAYISQLHHLCQR